MYAIGFNELGFFPDQSDEDHYDADTDRAP